MKNIIIVDDSKMKVDDIKRHLSKKGNFEIKVFRTAESFIDYVTQSDLEQLVENTELFLDWKFPWSDSPYNHNTIENSGGRVLKLLDTAQIPIPTVIIAAESVEFETEVYPFVHDHIRMDYSADQDHELEQLMDRLFS